MSAFNRFLGVLLLPLLIVVAALVASALYIVDEREKALVLRLGRVVDVKEEPGLGFKVPFLDDVVKYDDRILGLSTTQLEITPLDDRRLMVEAFARWRIVNVVQFRQAVGPGGIDAALARLDPIVRTAVREVLGSVPSTNVLSDDRTALMNRIRDEARANSAGLGVEIIDVRLTRTDLPEQNLNATYERMRAEREREAADEIARGGEAARRITAAADRTVVELTSEARRSAEIIRGEADAERNSIYAEAFGVDPEFFAFSRSMTSYTRALQAGNSQIVMQPDGEFFSYLRSDGAEGANPNPTPRPRSELSVPTEPTLGTGTANGEAGADPIAPSDYQAPRPIEMPWDAPGGMGPIGGEPSPFLVPEDEAAPGAAPGAAEGAPAEPAAP
ncbi:MAG: protease modulator HflC, partial [Paracoccus sp. (in: a-proteobacteria)]|nr:protease modulator HflC [Paracoccus sp. (in: a-proteobacteria)]